MRKVVDLLKKMQAEFLQDAANDQVIMDKMDCGLKPQGDDGVHSYRSETDSLCDSAAESGVQQRTVEQIMDVLVTMLDRPSTVIGSWMCQLSVSQVTAEIEVSQITVASGSRTEASNNSNTGQSRERREEKKIRRKRSKKEAQGREKREEERKVSKEKARLLRSRRVGSQ